MTTLPTDKRAAAYGEQRMNHLQAAGYIVENGDGMSNAEPQAICRDERDALDAPAEAGGAGASLKKQFREMVADYVERLIEKGLDNSGFSSEATLRATADKVVAEIGEDYLKDTMDRLVEQVMRVARHDFALTDDHIDDAHVSIGCWPMGNRKEWYRKRRRRENG